MASDWKDRLGVVFSTNPDFKYTVDEQEEAQTLAPAKQDLRIWRDSKQRAGKVATVVRGFVGSEADLKELGRMLKQSCGVGGSVKDGEIIIQGDLKDKVFSVLVQKGYRCKKV